MRILLSVMIINVCLGLTIKSQAQIAKPATSFTTADTLRGMLRLERTAYDVRHYNIDLDFDLTNKSITGSVIMTFDLVARTPRIQIDLFKNMKIDAITILDEEGQSPLSFERVYNAVFVDLPVGARIGSYRIKIAYHGSPIVAKFPPWDGGFIYRKDSLGNPWIAVACEGIGASLWWPNKDHLSDEPDSIRFSMTIPDSLTGISNGLYLGSRKKIRWANDLHLENFLPH